MVVPRKRGPHREHATPISLLQAYFSVYSQVMICGSWRTWTARAARKTE
jgi:hypothetical protein